MSGELADLGAAAVVEVTNALQYKARRRRVLRMLEDLAVLVERTMLVIDLAQAWVSGRAACRLVWARVAA